MHTPDQSPTAVLVHGAWADGSSWSSVITELRHDGVAVVAAPIPLTSLHDDVAAVVRAIERIEGPVVLAAHAYAGAVISAARHPRIHGLVFIAALAPDEGETVGDVFYRNPAHPQAPELSPTDDGWIWLPANAFRAAFAHRATADEIGVLAAVQRPIAVRCIQEPVARPLWKDLPSWYLLAEEDRMINPATQDFMANRMRARISSLDVDHTPMVSSPRAVADVIAAAVSARRVVG
jgi:pimeloyl-ACP methyl ester carboxylesterase